MTIGQIVFSKCGHDQGKAFVVVDLGDGCCYLADGASRKLANPKRKKSRHVRITNTIDERIRLALLDGGTLLDADLREALAVYRDKIPVSGRTVGQEVLHCPKTT